VSRKAVIELYVDKWKSAYTSNGPANNAPLLIVSKARMSFHVAGEAEVEIQYNKEQKSTQGSSYVPLCDGRIRIYDMKAQTPPDELGFKLWPSVVVLNGHDILANCH
jgi:hypothetical protein